MKKKLILGIWMLCQFVSRAHQNIHLADSTYHSSDSCFIFATTRSVFLENGKQTFGNTISSDQLLRFYNVYFEGSEIKIAPRRTLSEAMNNVNISKDFVIYTEGDGKTFSDNIERSIHTTRIYGISVIMFDWPSRVPGYSIGKNFYVSLHNSKSVSKQFNELLLLIGDYKTQAHKDNMRHVSMFFHSIGNYVLLTTLKNYGADNYNKDLIDNIIFNAACIPSYSHRKWIEKLSFQKNIYIVYNTKDRILKGAKFLIGRCLLGRRPFHLAKNAYYFNLRPAANILHNCFLRASLFNGHPEIQTFYDHLFHAVPINLANPCIKNIRGVNNNYAIL